MKKYEGKSFVFQGHTIKIMTVDKEGNATLKIGGAFQNVRKEDLQVIVQNGTEVAESCDMEEGCSSCGS